MQWLLKTLFKTLLSYWPVSYSWCFHKTYEKSAKQTHLEHLIRIEAVLHSSFVFRKENWEGGFPSASRIPFWFEDSLLLQGYRYHLLFILFSKWESSVWCYCTESTWSTWFLSTHLICSSESESFRDHLKVFVLLMRFHRDFLCLWCLVSFFCLLNFSSWNSCHDDDGLHQVNLQRKREDTQFDHVIKMLFSLSSSLHLLMSGWKQT